MKKYLIFGAGVLGSVYAAKFQQAGADVTILARGKRFEDIKKHGVVLELFESGEPAATPVKVVDQMPQDEYFDVCVVAIQRTHIKDALPVLKTNKKIPAFLFMHNTVRGFDPLIEALGQERVIIGHANLGGERVGHTVHYMTSQNMTLGELDGQESERIKQIAADFQKAGFGVEFNQNMDAWKKYHMALGVPMTNAMYMADGCNYRLAKDKVALKKFVHGLREGFEVLKTLGYPIEPKAMRMLAFMPNFLLRLLFKFVFGMKIMDIGGARHANNAREEMSLLSKEFLALADEAGIETPTLRTLHQYSLNPG